MLFVLSAPSGSGKTTIAHRIMKQFPELGFSVSATTRKKRPTETDGVDYFLLTEEQFSHRLENDGLVEWEEIYGNRYGTLKSEVDSALRCGEHLLFDVDVKGALAVKRLYGDHAVLIFIRPPGMDILRRRLEKRGTDSREIVDRRLERAKWELEQEGLFDFVVVNDDLSHSVPAVADIIGTRINAASADHGLSRRSSSRRGFAADGNKT